jgi:hypothetical protein
MKLTLTPERNLLVSEHLEAQRTGRITVQNRSFSQEGEPPANVGNTGRISIYDRSGNRKCTILDGLPTSVTSTVTQGRTVYIEIGAWDLVIPGPIPGTEIPNPHPSSPILASVLAMTLPRPCDDLPAGFSITMDDHTKLAQKQRLTLTNADGSRATLRMLVKLPNYTPAPVPGVPNAVRGSNLFGMVERRGSLYLSDAAQNTVVRVVIRSGRATNLLTFPQLTNPGGTPPAIDAVPDSIRLHGDRLLVPLLSGFPFPAGVAEVRAVAFDGSESSFIKGLTSAIDVLPVRMAGGRESFFVIEFSLDQNANAPGRLLRYDTPTGQPVTVADGLISPTNMVYDEHERTIYITEVFAGNIRMLKLA